MFQLPACSSHVNQVDESLARLAVTDIVWNSMLMYHTAVVPAVFAPRRCMPNTSASCLSFALGFRLPLDPRQHGLAPARLNAGRPGLSILLLLLLSFESLMPRPRNDVCTCCACRSTSTWGTASCPTPPSSRSRHHPRREHLTPHCVASGGSNSSCCDRNTALGVMRAPCSRAFLAPGRGRLRQTLSRES